MYCCVLEKHEYIGIVHIWFHDWISSDNAVIASEKSIAFTDIC